jgi:ribosomal protein S4E
MYSRPAHKTPTCAEEQICISILEAMKSIKGIAVYSDGNVRRERRILIENVPVGMMDVNATLLT